MKISIPNISGTIRSAVNAISQRVTNIAMSTPASINAEDRSIVTACSKDWLTVSISLVTIESVSPY